MNPFHSLSSFFFRCNEGLLKLLHTRDMSRDTKASERAKLSGVLPNVLHLFNIIYGRFYDANDTYTESTQYQI